MEGFSFGFLLIRWNSILIGAGILLGMALVLRLAKQSGQIPLLVSEVFPSLMVWGLIGARLWHIFTPSLSALHLGLTTKYYLSHPVEIFAIWKGGFGIAGVWLGGLGALLWVARRNQASFWLLADLLAPGFALAQSIGRFGNYFNQELYGLPTSSLLSVFIAPAGRLPGYESIAYYQPLFAWEMLLNLGIVLILLWLLPRFSRLLKEGDSFLAYLALYAIGRFILEFFRLDVALLSGVNANQAFFLCALLCTLLVFFVRHTALPVRPIPFKKAG